MVISVLQLFNNQQKSRLVQIQSICTRQVKYVSNNETCSRSDRKLSGKWRKTLVKQHFLLFPLSFQKSFLSSFCPDSVVKSKTHHLLEQRLNPFPNKPWFLHVCSTSLLKTLWEKEKLLVISNFSFCYSVFYAFGKLSAIFIKLKIVVCKLFQFGIV